MQPPYTQDAAPSALFEFARKGAEPAGLRRASWWRGSILSGNESGAGRTLLLAEALCLIIVGERAVAVTLDRVGVGPISEGDDQVWI